MGGGVNPDEFYQYWPEVQQRLGVGRDGEAGNRRHHRMREDHYRTGISNRRRVLSGNPTKEECAIARYRRNIETRWYGPYIKWESLTDTAATLYEGGTTRNLQLSKTKRVG